jgi:hypothetical protein
MNTNTHSSIRTASRKPMDVLREVYGLRIIRSSSGLVVFWPARSPDLIVRDILCMGTVRENVYRSDTNTVVHIYLTRGISRQEIDDEMYACLSRRSSTYSSICGCRKMGVDGLVPCCVVQKDWLQLSGSEKYRPFVMNCFIFNFSSEAPKFPKSVKILEF